MITQFEPVLISNTNHARIRAHHARAMPWLERHFGVTPLITMTYPDRLTGDAVFHETYANVQSKIANVSARTSSGVPEFVAMNAHNIRWLLSTHYVVELDGWGPMLDDPQRAAFARLVLSPHESVSEDDVFAGARRLCDLLAAEKLQAIPVLDGFRGLTLWIPFADGPTYDRAAAWLHAFTHDAVARYPDTFTVASLRAERGDCIYLGTNFNYPGNGALLPYALRGTPALEVPLPVPLEDLGKVIARSGRNISAIGAPFRFDHSKDDVGDGHVNSEILNYAFYLLAMKLGGNSWDVARQIWYEAMTPDLGGSARFHNLRLRRDRLRNDGMM